MTRLLTVLALGLTMFSCGDLVEPPKVLPNSGGGADEVMVVADENLWRDYMEKPTTELLNQEFEMLPQYEPVFKFGYVKIAAFEGLVKQHRNLIVMADLSSKSTVNNVVKEELGKDAITKALADSGFAYVVKNNVWSDPQIVVFVIAESAEKLRNGIKQRGEPIVEVISKHEVKTKYTAGLYAPNINKELTQKVANNLGITLRIPPEYFMAMEKPNFLWFRWEPIEASNNLFIYTEPLLADTAVHFNRPIVLRDSLGKAYVSTAIKNTYMVTDTTLPYVQRMINVNGYDILETRGLWEIENDFMGGPFLNYYIFDKANNRAVMLDGFVYSPKGKKRMRIRFMETIFATFKNTSK